MIFDEHVVLGQILATHSTRVLHSMQAVTMHNCTVSLSLSLYLSLSLSLLRGGRCLAYRSKLHGKECPGPVPAFLKVVNSLDIKLKCFMDFKIHNQQQRNIRTPSGGAGHVQHLPRPSPSPSQSQQHVLRIDEP